MNTYILKANNFLYNCLYDGLAHSLDTLSGEYVKPYPEVTGYLIKYFCDSKIYLDKVISAADCLVDLQDDKTGGFSSFYDTTKLYAFDTSQILTGLCAAYTQSWNNRYLESALKAGEFLAMMQLSSGAFVPVYDKNTGEKVLDSRTYKIWNGPFSGLMCKLTEGYSALYNITNDEKWNRRIKLTVDYYRNAPYIECSHPLGYWLEGLYAAGEYDKIDKILKDKVLSRICSNGFIAYNEQSDFAYVSGTIQLGIILYKMGYRKQAEQVRNYGRLVQSKCDAGGIFQYANPDGTVNNTIHAEMNSWGTKYFCELEKLIEDNKND